MATTSPGEYLVRGLKISLKLLQEVANDLPPPAASVVGVAQQIIEILDQVKKNKEDFNQIRDRILELLPVILMALKTRCAGKKNATIPDDFKRSVDRLNGNLLKILEDVKAVTKVVNSSRKRHKIARLFNAQAYTEKLQQCKDDLDWAMQEFNVTSRLSDSVRLCDVSRTVHVVLTNALLESLPHAIYASSSCERPDRPASCFEGTRTALLQLITNWMTNPDPVAPRCFWLSGLAGIGKTTVAHSIAELARSLGILGADFFFSRRGEAELRNPALVFPTIAYQLALFDPEFSLAITAALEEDPTARTATVKQQLDRLIIKPLSSLRRDPNRVVLILFDAFDECEPKGAKEVLQLLVASLSSLPFFVKILITSRPEQHIRSVLLPSSNLSITALHDIEQNIVTSDIKHYLRARLRSLPKDLGIDDLSEDWITEAEIQLLVDAAGTLFVHAATSLRFLTAEAALTLRDLLSILLDIIRSPRLTPSSPTNPYMDLDNLYQQILLNLVSRTTGTLVSERFRRVVGTIVLLRDPLPVGALAHLTQFDTTAVTALLSTLHSVVLPPGPPDYCPRVYHPSFPDFLRDPLRCTDDRLWINPETHEARLALRCLEIMNGLLHKDMLGDFASPVPNSEVSDLDKRVKTVFPPELQYACRFWATHIAGVSDLGDKEILAALAAFASRRLLPWLESMSCMGQTREAVDCLELANSWMAKAPAPSITTSLLNDGYRLLLAHFPTITESASHLSRSVLPFAPRNIQLLTTYTEYADSAVKVVYPVELEWSPCLMTWKSHSRAVFSVAISPDGTRVASGSMDGNIHIHDASSGGFITALTDHFAPVYSVAFSPDGSRVASGSSDHTVRLWNATTSQETLKLEGHTEAVYSVAFSLEGGRVASGSGDRTIRVWDAVTGEVLVTLKGHSGKVWSVCVFPGGSQLVSGSSDKTARIWDLESGTCVVELEGHSGVVYSVAAFSDESRIASGSSDNTIRIWDVPNGACLATLLGHTDEVNSVEFSPSGDRIVSGSDDSTARLWNATTGDPIATFRGHTDWARSVVFSHDGRRVVSGSRDATVKIWDASALTETTSQDGTAHSNRVVSLAFSSDGARLASFDYDDSVQVRDLVESHTILSFPIQQSLLSGWSIHFSPDDAGVIIAHQDSDENAQLSFDATSGQRIEEEEPQVLDVRYPSQTPFEIEDGRLLRNDVSPSTTICILPPAYKAKSTAISSFKLEETVGERVAVGFEDGRVLVLDVSL